MKYDISIDLNDITRHEGPEVNTQVFDLIKNTGYSTRAGRVDGYYLGFGYDITVMGLSRDQKIDLENKIRKIYPYALIDCVRR